MHVFPKTPMIFDVRQEQFLKVPLSRVNIDTLTKKLDKLYC